MNPEEFAENAPGRVVRSVLGHWTFLPEPLPPVLSFDMNMIRQFSVADQALGELAGLGRRLPNPHLLIRPFISREAVLSSRIEGTVTRLDQLFLFDVEPEEIRYPADAEEVQNYVRAVEHGLEQIRQGRPFTLQMLREIHAILLSGVRGADKQPGQIRSRAVLIGRSHSFDEARFVPPCHTTLDPLLIDLVKFLQEGRDLPLVVQLALVHYQFETIHPFNDGNGRVGRLLMTLMLCERECLPAPLLYLSAYFERNREEYYDGLLNVSRRSAWNEWLAFFARGIAEQARDASVRASKLLDLWQQYRNRAADIVRSSNALRLIDELFAIPFINVGRASEVMKVAYKSASRTIERFVEAGILKEITGQQRYRIFSAPEVFRLLDSPLEEINDASEKHS